MMYFVTSTLAQLWTHLFFFRLALNTEKQSTQTDLTVTVIWFPLRPLLTNEMRRAHSSSASKRIPCTLQTCRTRRDIQSCVLVLRCGLAGVVWHPYAG